MRYIDATRDYTIVDAVRDNYRRLQFEQSLHNVKKEQKKQAPFYKYLSELLKLH